MLPPDEQPLIEALVVNLNVPRAGPADLYAGERENFRHFPGGGGPGMSGGVWDCGRRLLSRVAVQTSSRGTHG